MPPDLPKAARGFPRWLAALLAGLFMMVWIVGFSSALASGRCLRDVNATAEAKLRACTVALSLWISPSDHGERARVLLEQALVMARLGRPEEAGEAFAKARDAAAQEGPSALAMLRDRLSIEQIALDTALGWASLLDRPAP